MEDTTYFAMKEGKACADILLGKADSWSQNLNSSGYLEKIKSMWACYHGAYYNDVSNGHQISFSGEQGELVNLPVNHFRNLASHMIIMTTSNRPAMDARAINTDYKSLVQANLANGILDYYLREKRLEKYLKQAVEHAVVLGAGFIKLEWNATAGEVYDYMLDDTTGQEDPKRPVYEGDIEFTNLSPFDVIMDGSKENQNHDWYLVRSFKNKYDLAAKYPELAVKITALQTKSDLQRFRVGLNNVTEETDDVPMYEFYHKKTDAVPNGRYMLFLEQDIVLQDIGLPYRQMPIFRISAGDILGTPYGYSSMFDVLPIQEAINTLYSTVLSNQNAFGVQNLWTKPNSNLNVTTLVGGLNLVESMEKPEPLNLTQTPKEIFDFIQILEHVAETITGVNSVARGNPEASLRTGAALALVQSMALQFMSGLQQSYVELIEDIGSSIIKILQDYAKTPRLVAIVGKNNRTQLKEFQGDDISNICRVYVDVGNPLAKTIAGRMELAQQMMQYQIVKNPNQLIQVLNTGRLDSLDGDLENELNLIQGENEALMDGQVPPVTIVDDHHQHIVEHRKPLQDPQLRKDPALVQRVTEHMQMHINALKETDPNLLQLLGQQPLPPDQPQGQVPQPPMPPGQGQQGVGPANPGDNHVNGPGLPPNGVNLPKVPTVNPALLPNPALQQQQQGK